MSAIEAVGKPELGVTAVVFPRKGIRDGDYRRIFGTNYKEIGEIGELSKEKRHAIDQMLYLRIQEIIPL